MRDVLTELMQWWRAGESVGVGTVVATFRSAPRPAGASMLVGPGGEVEHRHPIFFYCLARAAT